MAYVKRINIYDTDQTTISGSAEEGLDVAFVPGYRAKYLNAKIASSAPESTAYTPEEALSLETVWYDTSTKKKYNLAPLPSSPAEWSAIPFENASAYTTYLTGGLSVTVPSFSLTTSAISANAYTSSTLPLPSVEWRTAYYLGQYSGIATEYFKSTVDNVTTYAVYFYQLPQTSELSPIDSSAKIEPIIYSTTVDITDESVAAVGSEDDVGYTVEDGNILLEVCTKGYKDAGDEYGYVEDTTADAYDYDEPKISKYNTFAAFSKDNGNEPTCAWSYTVKGYEEPVDSFLKPYDFAYKALVTQGYTKITDVDINRCLHEDITNIEIKDVDRGWLYAAELLVAGLPIFYQGFDIPQNGEASSYKFDNLIYDANDQITDDALAMYRELIDNGEYDVKYLTTGVCGLNIKDGGEVSVTGDTFDYPLYAEGAAVNRSVLEFLVDIANYRKDCSVLVDAKETRKSPLYGSGSVYDDFDKLVVGGNLANLYTDDLLTSDDIAKAGRNAHNTYPWVNEVCNTFPSRYTPYRVGGNVFAMPGSFAYLKSLAESMQKYPASSWEAIAGVTRGLVPNFVSLDIDERLSNAVADAYSQRNKTGINAITNVRPYGYCIWGNHTLVDNAHFAKQGDGTDGLIASSFVDIMSMVHNVNKVARRTAKRLMFEKNNNILWARFIQGVSPYLDQLVSSGALETYEIKKIDTEKRGHLIAKIVLTPVYSLESIDCEILLRDTEAVAE